MDSILGAVPPPIPRSSKAKVNEMSKETLALLQAIDTATTAIGARIQKLIDGSSDTALNAALQAEVDKLTALGTDPGTNSVLTALDQETTPILD